MLYLLQVIKKQHDLPLIRILKWNVLYVLGTSTFLVIAWYYVILSFLKWTFGVFCILWETFPNKQQLFTFVFSLVVSNGWWEGWAELCKASRSLACETCMSLVLAACWLSLCPYTQLPLCPCFLFTSVALCQVIREVWVKACPLSTLHSSVTVLSKHKGKRTSSWLKSNTNDILREASYKAAIYLILFIPPNSPLKYYSHFRQAHCGKWLIYL